MAKMIFEIDDKLEEQFRNEVFQRKGLKRGVIKDALIEAMNLWIKNDITERLKQHALRKDIIESEREDTIETLSTYGKPAIPALTEMLESKIMLPSQKEQILKYIREMPKT